MRAADAQHAEYKGLIRFKNVFDGQLPAGEYPKITFYGILTVVYIAIGLGWGFLCYRHFAQLLPIQVCCRLAC